MKVILAHKFFHLTGGADVFFFEVGRVLKENGHEVAYFSTKDPKNIESEYEKYFVNPPRFSKGNLFVRFFNFFKIPYNFEAKRKFKKLINEFNPDIIHVFNIATHLSPSILDVARKNKIPVVASLNDYKHICPNYKLFHHGKICEACKKNKYYNAILNKCCHNSYLYSTASSIEAYIHYFLNIYKKNISLFLFASDFMAEKTKEFWGSGFNWSKLLNPYKIPDEALSQEVGKYGLYFGRLIDEKGVDILIDSLNQNKDIPFKIVGDGPDLMKLKEYAKKNNLINVEFMGAIWGASLNELIRKSKFVVIPSIWHENFPYVILQSFAAGKPVIGTNRGGIPELIIENERGLIYDANNPTDLSGKMRLLYENNEMCLELGKNARKYLEDNFNNIVFYNQLVSNYKMVLK